MISYLDTTPRKSFAPVVVKAGGPGSGRHKESYNLPEGVGREVAKSYPLHSTWYRHPNYKQHAYGGVMVNNAGQFLLREPSGHFDGYAYTWPKGKMDHEGEHPVDVALRELKEETGYKGRIFDAVPGTFVSGSGSRANFYLMRSHGQEHAPDFETKGLKWVNYHEAKDLIKQSPNRMGRIRDLAVLEYARNRIEKHRKIESLADVNIEATAYSELGEYLCSLGTELESYLFTIACGGEWDDSKHPHEPAGSPKGGQFAPTGGEGKATGKYHQHATLLKAFGWKMTNQKKGPNPEHPEKTSILQSVWEHPQHGTIEVNHSKHTFTHLSKDFHPETGEFTQYATKKTTGKSNVVLEQHLIQHHANPNDVAKPAVATAKTVATSPVTKSNTPATETDSKAAKMAAVLGKHGYTTSGEVSGSNKYVKDTAPEESAVVKQHYAYIQKDGDVNHYQAKFGAGHKYTPLFTPEGLDEHLSALHGNKATYSKPTDQIAEKLVNSGYKLVSSGPGGTFYKHPDTFSNVSVHNDGTWVHSKTDGTMETGHGLSALNKHLEAPTESKSIHDTLTQAGWTKLEQKTSAGNSEYSFGPKGPMVGAKTIKVQPGGSVWTIGNGWKTHDELHEYFKANPHLKNVTPAEVEKAVSSILGPAAPKGPPPPGKLVEQYIHTKYGHVYTWNPASGTYKSSQGKDLAPSKLAWMNKQELVKPTVVKTDEPAFADQVNEFHTKSITQKLNDAGYTYHHNSPQGNKIYSNQSGQAIKVIGDELGFTPGALNLKGKFVPQVGNLKLPISGLSEHLSDKPNFKSTDTAVAKHDMALDIAQKYGFIYSHHTNENTYFNKPNGDLLAIDKANGKWKHVTSDDYPSVKGSTPAELEQHLSKSNTITKPAAVEDVSTYKYAGAAHELGGAFPKHFFTDDSGSKYMFKPGQTLSGHEDPLKAHVDETASKIQAILRPDANVPVQTVRMNLPDKQNVLGSLQKMITNLDEKPNFKGVNPVALPPQDVKGLQQEHVVDWLIANHDAHSNQFLRTTDGKVIAIDKTQSFKNLGSDKLSIEYHPNTQEEEPYYNKLFMAIKSGQQKFDPQNSLATIQKAQSISDDEYKAILKPYVDSRFDSEAQKTEFYQQALDRKKDLKTDFEKFYSDVLGKKFKFGEGLGKSATVPEVTHDALNAYGWHKNFDGQKVDAYKQAGSTKYLTVDKTTGKWAIKDTGNNSIVKQGNDFNSLDLHVTGGKPVVKSTAKGNAVKPPEIYSPTPDKISPEMHQALEDTGFRFKKYGSNSGMPLYKDSGGKAVYVKPDNSYEYYPMGTSGPGKTYGSQIGKGTKALTEAVTTPFEKPVAQQSEEFGTGKSSSHNINPVTGKLGTPSYPELKEVPYDPISDKQPQAGKGKEAGYQIGGTPSQTVDLTGTKGYSTSELGAINYYKGSGYGDINPWLASKKDSPLDESSTATRVKALDSAMTKAVINKNQILFRAVNHDYAQDLANTLQIGSVHKPYSFQSTATHQSFSHDSWSQGDKLIFRIKVPKGANAIAVEKARAQHSGSDGEHEVILPRDVAYKVTDIYHSGNKIYADVDLVAGTGVKIKAMADRGSIEHYADVALGAKNGNEMDMALGSITNPDGSDGTPLSWKLTAEEVMEKAEAVKRHHGIVAALAKLRRMVSKKK